MKKLEKAAVRKLPTQERSRKRVEHILVTTRELICAIEGYDIARVTTAQIAKEADVSVGSLYQYFPNVESIFLALYEEMVAPIREVLEEFDSAAMLSMPKEDFFDSFNRAMTSRGPDREFVFAMQQATKVYPALVAAETRHSEYLADKIASFLKYFGSSWPLPKLQRLALYMFYLDYGTWFYRQKYLPEDAEIFEWELGTLNTVWARAFEEDGPGTVPA